MSITLTALQKQRRDTAANWTTANPTLLAGEIGIDSDSNKIKIGDGSTAWASLAYTPWSQPTGGGTNAVFYENDQTVTTNYALTANKNAMSVGPVAIAAGVTVTIPASSTWVIL